MRGNSLTRRGRISRQNRPARSTAQALTSGEVLEFEILRQLYDSEPGLQVPASVTTYVNGSPTLVTLR